MNCYRAQSVENEDQGGAQLSTPRPCDALCLLSRWVMEGNLWPTKVANASMFMNY